MKPIYVSKEDYERLSKIIREFTQDNGKAPEIIRKLRDELERATVVETAEFRPNVVGLRSRVKLRDLQTDEIEEWVLTLPEQANSDQQRLSVLAPVGTAILGYTEGDEIEWETPGGVRKLKIEQVEPAGPLEIDPLRSLYG